MAQSLFQVLQETTQGLFLSFIDLMPNLANAFIVLVVGYILGKAISKLIEIVLKNFFNLDLWLKRKKLQDAFFGFSLASILSGVVKWYVYFAFIIQAITMLNVQMFSGLLDILVIYTPKLFAFIFIIIFGALISEWVKQQTLRAKIPYRRALASFIKGIGLYIFFVAALQNVGIDTTIFVRTFEIFMIGLVLTFSLTLGISFGLAMKDDAKKWLKKMRKA